MDDIEARREELRRLIEKRSGVTGWAANVKALEAALRALEDQSPS